MLNSFRWWLFKQLCPIVWRICPKPHRTALFSSMSFDKEMWKEARE